MATVSAPLPIRASTAPGTPSSLRVASAVLMSLFFAIGFLTCLNDIIIPHFKALFALNYAQAMLIQFSFFTAYFVVSSPAGRLVRAVGYKNGILVGLGAAALGCVCFYPAAAARSYPMFLVAMFILASGFTVLQVAANPYVAILGDPETASSRLTLTQAFNSLGTTLAPMVGSSLILNSSGTTRSVQMPYLVFASTLLVAAGVIALVRMPTVVTDESASATKESRGALGHARLVFGAVGIFVYVGAEVSIGSFLVGFFKEPSIAGLLEADAARYVSFYWGGAMVGRFVGAALLRLWKPGRVLAVAACFAALLVVATIATSGHVAMATILAVGLMNSIMFPTIFTLAIDGLGSDTSQGSGILCMAIVGGAILPVIQGLVADRVGVQLAFLLPAACYAYIAWYGLRGHALVWAKR